MSQNRLSRGNSHSRLRLWRAAWVETRCSGAAGRVSRQRRWALRRALPMSYAGSTYGGTDSGQFRGVTRATFVNRSSRDPVAALARRFQA